MVFKPFSSMIRVAKFWALISPLVPESQKKKER
jgi:hypothetical protein